MTDLLRQAHDEMHISGAADDAPPWEGLPNELREQFEMFLENNELELAWDALAAVADENGAPGTVWEKLLVTAGLMSLAEQAHLAATRFCSAGFPSKQAS